MTLLKKYTRRFESRILEGLIQDLQPRSKDDLIEIFTEHDAAADTGRKIERFINVTIAGVAHAVLLETHHYDTATKQIVSKTK